MPNSNQATKADVYFVYPEAITGLMEWAYHKEDERGIKAAAYARFVVDKFGGVFLHNLAQGSKLYAKYRTR